MAEASAEGERETGAPETEEPESGEPEEFLNRAARRAKGKKRGPVTQADSRAAHGRDVVQSRRQFGNRRTGG